MRPTGSALPKAVFLKSSRLDLAPTAVRTANRMRRVDVAGSFVARNRGALESPHAATDGIGDSWSCSPGLG